MTTIIQDQQITRITQHIAKKGFTPTTIGYYRKGNKIQKLNKQICFKRCEPLTTYIQNLTPTGFNPNTTNQWFTQKGVSSSQCPQNTQNTPKNTPKTCEFFKNSHVTQNEKPLISSGLGAGSSSTMGHPELILTPSYSGLPILSNFDSFTTMKRVRSERESLLIGFDAEWYGEPRTLLSWQFSLVWGDCLYEYIFFNHKGSLLSLDIALSKILDDLGFDSYLSSLYSWQEACVGFDALGKPIWDRFEETDNDLVAAADFVHPLFFNDLSGKWEPASYTISEGHQNGLIDKFAKRGCRPWKWSNLKRKFPTKHNVTLICHTGKVDLTTLLTETDGSILRYVSEVQGGTISLQPVSRFIKSRSKGHVGSSFVFPLTLNFRDTMAQAPAGKKSLAALGDAIKVPKLSDKHINKSDMKATLSKHPKLYVEYACRDATVTMLYASAIYGYNREMAVTITSAGARVFKASMVEYFGLSSDKEFDSYYRGIERVKKGLVKNMVNPGFLNATAKQPRTEVIRDILMYASESYHGGLNTSTCIGWFEGLTNDFDLRNAYPTAMALVPDIDWDNPVLNELTRVPLTLNLFRSHLPGGLNTMLPFFGRVTFEFPRDVKYPCIPVNVEGRLIFPRTSKGLDVVYASGPEICLALQLGAKVFCERGWVLAPRFRDDNTESHSLAYAVRGCIDDRSLAKDMLGKGSLEELILKVLANSGYGKNAQNVVDKTSWDAYSQSMIELGDSAITNPVSASLTTSFVRALLLATMNEAYAKGYTVYSCTTDGFIGDIPSVDILENFDLYGFVHLTHQSRLYLTSGKDKSIWEIKHHQTELLNVTTRGNMAPTLGGVSAHNSTKSPYPSGSVEDRNWFIDKCLSRDNRVPYHDSVWTTFKDLSKGAEFKVVDVTRRVSMDYDMKRKPIRTSFHTVFPVLNGITYEIANFDTEPFEDVDEARRYEKTKKLCNVLRTQNQWDLFWAKLSAGATGKQIRLKDGIEWAKLLSCVMGARRGLWVIDELNDPNTTVQDKCDWLNSLNLSPKQFKTSDWKNARRPERQVNMLGKDDIIDFLQIMGAKNFTV